MTRIKVHISNVKLPFYPPCEVKCRLQNRVSTCLNPKDAEYVLREIHDGVCGNHCGPRSLVRQVVRAGYFWLTMQKDAA